jgi:L-alanine-DL-glutamate epimerase-like enolase superfamily enzyme
MKIVDIEIIPIFVPLAERYRVVKTRRHVHHRMVFKVHTDVGITGVGDYDWNGPPPPFSEVEPLIGRNPFDFINNNFNLGLGSALYDAIGKYLEVPAYKLMGQKLRDAGSVAAWSWGGPSPEQFAEDICRAADQGYTIFKIHCNPLVDIMEWTRAAEEVAPPGFKLHYDFTGRRGPLPTLAAMMPIVKELESHSIVGWIEDPLPRNDIDGWRRLRAESRVPIVHGGQPMLGGLQEVMLGMADIYMIGGDIGNTMALGMAYGKANIQTILQNTGGTLMKAFTLHMASVLPTATGHSINLEDQAEWDITTETIPVTEGFSPVPERPGLGFDIDEKALARAAANEPPDPPDFIGVTRMPGGHTFYSFGQPNITSLTGKEQGTIRGIGFERWLDDGSPEFQKTLERLQNDGTFNE